MKNKKKFIVLLVITILNLSLSGCWNSREINSLGFVTSIGFDKTNNGMLMTVQVLNPRVIASQKTVDEPTVVVYTEEGKDPFEMIRKMITQSSRKLNVTHLQTVIFGEEFAKDGVSDVLDFLSREHQFRTDIYFAVAKGSTANTVLNTLTKLDANPSVKLYSSMNASDQIWAGTKSIKIIELINSIIADGNNPVLPGVEVIGDSKNDNTIEELKKTKTDPLKIMNSAVFKKDKFAGWLNEDESKGYNCIIGHVQSTVGHVEDKSIGKISFEVTGTDSKQKVFLLNKKPAINVEVDVKANIETVPESLDVTKSENLQKVEKLIKEKITANCYNSIKKAQKDLKSDIFGFGEVIHRYDPELWNTVKDNWNNEFSNLPVNVNINVKIEGTGTITKSFFMKEKK